MGQERYGFMTPKVDTICQNTLELIRIKHSLILQQYAVDNDVMQIQHTIDVMNAHLEEAKNERIAIDNELLAINRHIDSLTPKRPDGPRPKENIIDILYERLSFHGSYGLNINQLALSNWAAGGENTFAGKAFASFTLLDHKKTFEQKLIGNFAFGIARFASKGIEKQDDKIDLTYSLSRNSMTQWNLSSIVTFNTQFANGYKYPNDSTVISTFFAPAYLTLSIGCSYKTKDERFQIYMSPSIWIPGEHIAPAIGVNFIINYKRSIGKNITYTTLLNTFYNYIERHDDDRLPIDVNWENTVNFMITKYISTILFVHLKYDHNTTFPVYDDIEGVQTVVDNVPKLQFKESLGIAFIHKF